MIRRNAARAKAGNADHDKPRVTMLCALPHAFLAETLHRSSYRKPILFQASGLASRFLPRNSEEPSRQAETPMPEGGRPARFGKWRGHLLGHVRVVRVVAGSLITRRQNQLNFLLAKRRGRKRILFLMSESLKLPATTRTTRTLRDVVCGQTCVRSLGSDLNVALRFTFLYAMAIRKWMVILAG